MNNVKLKKNSLTTIDFILRDSLLASQIHNSSHAKIDKNVAKELSFSSQYLCNKISETFEISNYEFFYIT